MVPLQAIPTKIRETHPSHPSRWVQWQFELEQRPSQATAICLYTYTHRTAIPNYIPKMYKCTSPRSTRIATPSCVTREQPHHHTNRTYTYTKTHSIGIHEKHRQRPCPSKHDSITLIQCTITYHQCGCV